MTPHRARTWGRQGRPPVIRVRGASRGRVSVAALACYKPGQRPRLIFQPRVHGRSRDERKSFAWTDYRDLVLRAHVQLGGPIVLIWDNLNVHRSTGMRQYAADHDWLTVVQLPSYAPDLNPVEGIWSVLRRTETANVAFTDRGQLVRAVRRGLKKLQYRPEVITGCLTGTGLVLTQP